jgi:TolB-like protein/Flp pilus assembly protein TadD
MTSEENRRGPFSIEVSARETKVDPQLSACAQDGTPPEGLADTLPPQRRRSETGRAQTSVSLSTVRLAVGQLLGGRYRIERELGEGGMGVVYLAADEQVPGERFAIKVLKEELQAEVLALLREEVRKTRRLSHPNIVDVHSVNVDGPRLYVLMEYLEGKSLDMLLDEDFGRGMPFSRAWSIIEDVGAALGNAHDHSVIHSDLKPANVFVTTSGRTKLLDFGIARVSRGPLLHKRSGLVALTPAYASCEMLEGEEADPRDDIYSFACVIYEMLCGKRPFGELTALEAREDAAKMPPLQVLSREQNGALAQALAFDREARTASVEQLLAGLGTDKAPRSRHHAVLGAALIATVAALGFSYLAFDKLWIAKRSIVVQSVTSGAQQAGVSPRSIAVLPFVDMSEKKDQEYFSDGLSEELIDLLARNRNLQVTARTSSFYFKGKQVTIAEIAKTLGVANVLEGSVRKSGNTLRVTAQLIRAADSYHLWSETYDRNRDDLFKVQDAIAGEVVSVLKVLLGAAATQTTADTPNIESNDLYLQAAFLRAQGSASGFNKAADLLARAVALDPSFARAWAMLSRIKLSQARDGTIPASEAERTLLEGRRAAERAVALAPDLTEPHLALGRVYLTVDLKISRAAAEFHRAFEINPRSADAVLHLGFIAQVQGQIEEHIRLTEQALALDPLDLNIMTILGQAYLNKGEPAAAELIFRRERELAPARMGVDGRLGDALLMLGRPKEALELLEKAASDDDQRQWVRAMVYPALGRKSEADAIVAALDKNPRTLSPGDIARLHAARGEIDLAFDWLERQYRTDPKGLTMRIWTDYYLRPLRGDPRYHALRRRLNLPD